MSGERSTFNQGNRPFIGNNTFCGNEVRASTLMTAFDTKCFASEALAFNRIKLVDIPATGLGGTREIPTRINPVVVLEPDNPFISLRLQTPKRTNIVYGAQETTIINASGVIQGFDPVSGNVAGGVNFPGGVVTLQVGTASKFLFIPAETDDPEGDGLWYPLVNL